MVPGDASALSSVSSFSGRCQSRRSGTEEQGLLPLQAPECQPRLNGCAYDKVDQHIAVTIQPSAEPWTALWMQAKQHHLAENSERCRERRKVDQTRERGGPHRASQAALVLLLVFAACTAPKSKGFIEVPLGTGQLVLLMLSHYVNSPAGHSCSNNGEVQPDRGYSTRRVCSG